jgi:21S rRNA (GM2251-2'-O)-methyltransferase
VQTKSFLVPPSTIPCTTAASEFIYGTSAVQAAIQCARRKLYVLYIYDVGENKPLSRTYWEDPLMKTLQKYALLAGAKVKRVRGPWLKMMDKMSDGRPHNNVILEASPLPRLPAASFDMVESPTAREFYVKLNSQPQENAEINGTDGRIQLACYRRTKESIFDDPEPEDKPPRYPLVLLLDGILDEGNLGGIIRSAHYLGVDAVAFSARNSAPLSPVTMKAAAGAAESIPLISVHDPRTLITKSRENGWRFFAAEAPSSARSDKNQSRAVLDPPDLASQLQISPCVLMLGGEGSGLSRMLSNSADSFVAIPGVYTPTPEVDKAGVDSLNVSVATAILCEAFLRLPSGGESASQIAPLQTPPMEKDEQSPEEKDEQVMF